MGRRTYLLGLLSNGTGAPPVTTAPAETPYDHNGAMWYVVTVVTVYAMAILFMIVSHINRRAGKRELDREVSAFLRSTPTVRVEEERQRRRNLKRAMQPFIRLALDRRTVAIQTLTSLSAELLPMTDRVMPARARHLSGRFTTSEASLLSGCTWHGTSADDADIVVVSGLNDKIVQCCLDPAESLISRSRRRLRAVPSETELGESASSRHPRMLTAVMEQQHASARAPASEALFGRWPLNHSGLDEAHQAAQSRNWLESQPPPQRQPPEESFTSPSKTHVPRFLAM
uniref:Ion_trans_2 domain-containing protein n=1 Tax=Macrostomum lignano TaxID=282301 RepID=A0A1I8HTW7_9PLAT